MGSVKSLNDEMVKDCFPSRVHHERLCGLLAADAVLRLN